MDRCQLLWLLDYGKVIGYSIEIPIPDPWILKEKENETQYYKDQMLIYWPIKEC